MVVILAGLGAAANAWTARGIGPLGGQYKYGP